MKGSTLRRVSALSGILGAGILVGLVLAGSWNVTPTADARDAVRASAVVEGTVPGGATVTAPGERTVPEVLSRPAPTVEGPAQSQALPSLREAASRVRPAVVSINVERFEEPASNRMRMNIPEEFRDMFRLPEEQQGPQRSLGSGSGFFFTSDGYLMTNNHVVEGASKVTVVLPDKRQFDATVVGADEITDVAVIKIDVRGESFPAATLGSSEELGIGDWVLAIGNPLEFDFTVTAGIVSARGRGNLNLGPVEGGVRQMIQDFIQTDAVINRGNSGGPLVDVHGHVVGINSAIASQTGFYEGYGFAIPIDLAKTVADDLIRYGEVKRSWLGITFNEVDALTARARSLPGGRPYGAHVRTVTPGGPADKAGLRIDDLILEIDGQSIDNSGRLQTLVSTREPGSRLPMKVYRGGTSRRAGDLLDITVRLEERPSDTTTARAEQASESADRLGLEVRELTRQERRDIDFDGQGVVIERVERYGPAFDARLQVGMVVTSIDGQDVGDLRTYERLVKDLRSGTVVMVRVYAFDPNAEASARYTSVPVEVR
jgi:serine protease Do